MLLSTITGVGRWTMGKNKVIVETLMPGMERYRPVHKSGVFDAIKGFCSGKKPKVRNKGAIGSGGQRNAVQVSEKL